MNNPFTLSFGKKPLQYISRTFQTDKIIDTFNSENPSNQIYMFSGVRGSGKTVMMTNIVKTLEEKPEWIVIELNSTRDLLNGLAAKLYDSKKMTKAFIEANIDLSLFNIGIHLKNVVPASDIEEAIKDMLKIIKKQNKKVLICIDEVSKNEYVRQFSSAFQILLRADLPIFLIMTGLYENIYDLQNDNSLTFLYRAPKIILEPLSISAIADSYQNIFKIDIKEAIKLATLTNGYPFAYQALGYLYFDNRNIDKILPTYDQYLEEYVYEKVWKELSNKDKEIMLGICKAKDNSVKTIRESLNMSSSSFSIYRDRLLRKGLIDTKDYGHINLVLPRFNIFCQKQEMIYNLSL